MDSMDAGRTFPFSAAEPFEPAGQYAELREREPVAQVVLPTGEQAWLVTRHEDVRAVCLDGRLSKEAVTAPGAPRLLPIARGSKSMVNLDPPQHTRLRRLVSKAFTTRRIDGLRPRITQITESLIDDLLGGPAPADAMQALALPLPITVICELLGVPVADAERFRGWSDLLLAVPGPAHDAEQVRAAGLHLAGYFEELIARERAEPSGHLIAGLLAAQDEHDQLDAEELRTFAMTLLVAGYHTTTSAIAHSLFHLLHRPQRYRQLRQEPGLLPAAVEELLRYSQVASGFGALRIATEEVEIGGSRIPAGAPVIPIFGSANRDREVFDNANDIDLARPDNPHLAFGAGIHYCLGAQLARAELQILFGALTARIPSLALAVQPQDVPWQALTAFPRPSTLLVCW